jgi:hypothetical protein
VAAARLREAESDRDAHRRSPTAGLLGRSGGALGRWHESDDSELIVTGQYSPVSSFVPVQPSISRYGSNAGNVSVVMQHRQEDAVSDAYYCYYRAIYANILFF